MSEIVKYLIVRNVFLFLEKEAAPPAGQKQSSVSQQQQLKQQELLRAAVQESLAPKEAPPEFEFVADPPSISAFDLDVVRIIIIYYFDYYYYNNNNSHNASNSKC